MDDLEQVVNKLSDSESEWWPFQFLRPEPEQRLGLARSSALAVLNGAPLGLVANLLVSLSGKTINPLFFPAMMTLAFFALYHATIAVFWNRRAERLALAPIRSRRR